MSVGLEIERFEKTFSQEAGEDGSYKMQECLFTKKFGSGPDEWPVEPGRYRLLWMPACPHAHKVVIVRSLLGLDKVITLGSAGPYRTERGWVFSEDADEIDPVLKIHYIDELYKKEDPDYKGRPTVPIIADTVTGRGVNNDHFWLTIYLETAWKKYHKEGAPDLYPENLRKEIDELNRFIYERINVGVYKAGFARTQEAYGQAYDRLFEALDSLDERLGSSRYLFGDEITDSDIRLYPTLARFDVVYYLVFRANRNRLADFKNLWPYARDLYQNPGFGDTTDFNFIKRSYQLSPHLKPLWGNVHSILAKGPDVSTWLTPHHRG